jgi:hypothetical protein
MMRGSALGRTSAIAFTLLMLMAASAHTGRESAGTRWDRGELEVALDLAITADAPLVDPGFVLRRVPDVHAGSPSVLEAGIMLALLLGLIGRPQNHDLPRLGHWWLPRRTPRAPPAFR